MPRGRKPIKPPSLPLLELIERSERARDVVKAMIAIDFDKKSGWRGLVATPPGTMLETVIRAFRETTDFPLEVPFFITLHYISAWLLDRGITTNFAGREVKPDLWTIVLAESGSGKSESNNLLGQVIQVPKMPESASAAKFIEDLAKSNHGLWVVDEFAQLLKRMESQAHMEELRDYLLRLYDNQPIARRTKRGEVIIEDPALSILGMTVKSTFLRNVSPETMLDGFAQRFQYVVADPDPDRRTEDFAIYRIWEPERVNAIRQSWEELRNLPLHNVYRVGRDAEEGFETSFSLMMPPHEKLPASFYRRIMFRGIKYALIYHILLGKESSEVDAQDMGWAGRVSGLHIQDAKWLLQEHSMPELEKLIKRAEELKARVEASEGRPVKPRDIVRGVYGIKSTREALAILSLINGESEDRN